MAIGNPGAGKSTILNAIATELLFKSGRCSGGGGLTYKLDEAQNKNGVCFIDTPGLDDVELRKAAACAISTALQKGGKHKLLFFVRYEGGRLQPQDLFMMQVGLKSAPEIRNQYGVIINKLSPKMMKQLVDCEERSKLLTQLFSNIDDGNNPVPSLPLPRLGDLDDEDNVVPNLADLPNLEIFIEEVIPTVKLTAQAANTINIEQYEEVRKEYELAKEQLTKKEGNILYICLLYTSDAADE